MVSLELKTLKSQKITIKMKREICLSFLLFLYLIFTSDINILHIVKINNVFY